MELRLPGGLLHPLLQIFLHLPNALWREILGFLFGYGRHGDLIHFIMELRVSSIFF